MSLFDSIFHHRQEFTSVLVTIEVRDKHHHYRQHHHHRRRYEIIIPPNEKVIPMANVNVTAGHTVVMALSFLDQNGNPMLTPVAPDAVPVWTDTTSATGTLTESADGLTASEAALAAGTDVVTVSLSVGGKAFTASLGITVTAAPQVLTSVGITSTVS